MFVTIGRLCIIVLVLFSYPLQCHPCRTSSSNVMESFTNTKMNSFRFFALTSAILTLSYIVAMSVHQLDLVLSFVGATGSTTICYM